MKEFLEGKVIKNEKLNDELFTLHVFVGDIVKECKEGQFASIYTNDSSMVLPRPISISEICADTQTLVFVIQKVGNGTKSLAELSIDDKINMLLPLGNGYDLDVKGELVYLIGGGVGIPPLVGTYKKLKSMGKQVKVILGYRDTTFLEDKFLEDDLYVCTDNGSKGFKGNVIEKLNELDKPEIIYSCGPKAMLKAVAEYGETNDVTTFISMEERMACSVGVCLGCVIKVLENGEVTTKKVCVDGPVFKGGEVVFE